MSFFNLKVLSYWNLNLRDLFMKAKTVYLLKVLSYWNLNRAEEGSGSVVGIP